MRFGGHRVPPAPQQFHGRAQAEQGGHNGMAADGAMMIVGSMVSKGVKGMAHIKDVSVTMADMGMNHGPAAEGGHGGMDHGSTDHKAMGHSADAAAPAAASHSMDGMSMRDTSLLPPDVEIGPGVDMVSMAPVDKMGDPGLGLRDVKHRVLNYRMLTALEANRDTREPSRLLELHLTGNMERYMWSFDGRMYSAVSDVPIGFAWNERVRVKLISSTVVSACSPHGLPDKILRSELVGLSHFCTSTSTHICAPCPLSFLC